jgi:L-fuculokinase
MTKATVIFDVGKTNKKILLFDDHGKILSEILHTLPLTVDDDGSPCEDIHALTHWIKSEWNSLLNSKDFNITAVNFTAYGASFVHLGKDGKPITSLYDYLKPVPSHCFDKFYNEVKLKTGFNSIEFAQDTCSPKLGMLNSGLQLYWLKHTKPALWKKIKSALHLPQYLSYLITGKKVSDYTSLGCHTALWDFQQAQYSKWLDEDTLSKLPPITPYAFTTVDIKANNSHTQRSIKVGNGLHDSSAALIPYFQSANNSFILISTGTWSIQLNPFNPSPLTTEQLNKDCLCYLKSNGEQVKASRLLLGKEHDHQVERIASHFTVSKEFIASFAFDKAIFTKIKTEHKTEFYPACMEGSGPFPEHQTKLWDISIFETVDEAYHRLIYDLVLMLKVAIQLIDEPEVETLFVDGGFARNSIFLNTLTFALHKKKVLVSYLPQSTAMGAFIHLHELNKIHENGFEEHFKAISDFGE